jgi:YD repeat-containing protein
VVVNQGNQTRAFKYDALGRLLYERIPEQSATINDGTGTFWTTKYTYTDFDKVATRQDARGVVTTYGYDTLHRMTQMSYNVTNAQGVAATPVVSYSYDDGYSSPTLGMLMSVSGGNQIQAVTLEQSGGAPTNRISSVTSGGAVNYTYDAAGNVVNDGLHSYTYDAENRVVSVDGGATATYGYDHRNRRVKKVVGGAVTHYVWAGNQVIAEHNAATGAQVVRYIYAGSKMIAKVEGAATRYFISDRLSTRLILDQSGNVVGRQSHLPFGEEIGGASQRVREQ